MEHTTSNPVAEPIVQSAGETPKKKKTGKMLVIVIPVVLVLIVAGIFAGMFISKHSQYKKAMRYLDEGDIAEAIEIHQELGDYKDLADEICDTAGSRCKKLLKKNDYARIVKLYKTVKDYPNAIEEVNERIEEHVATLLNDHDYYTVLDLCDGLKDAQAAMDVILNQINSAADAIWENIYMSTELYDALAERGIHLEAMDANVVKNIRQHLQDGMYWEAVYYYERLGHSENAQRDAQAVYVEAAKACMELGEPWDVETMLRTLSSSGISMELLNKAVYDYACMMMESKDYSAASTYFAVLQTYVGDYEDCAAKLEELAFYDVVEELERYISNGWYSDAKYLVDSYTGEKYEKLLEIYLPYCGDSTFITDLEAALLARMELANADAAELELVKAEENYLLKYWNMPFYDSTLQTLAQAYLYALDDQRNALSKNNSYYDAYYYWNLAAADRYIALDGLVAYGFGSGDARLQELLGIGAELHGWINAWKEIHDCLSYYLWSVVPYEENGVYYLDVYNYTAYTFTFYVEEEFYANADTLLHTYTSEAVTVNPGEWFRVVIDYPEDQVDFWYIDWDIYDIYQPSYGT